MSDRVGSRTVAAITVERADSLVSVDGRFFKRVGKTNQVMSPEELRQRLVATRNSTWDRQIERTPPWTTSIRKP
jgi:predicted HTH transcriptional regulator